MDGDAVRVRAGLELVGHPERELPLSPGVRVVGLGDPGRLLREQHLALEVEEFGLLAPLVLPPGVEVRPGDHVLGDPLVVEVEEGLVVDHDVAAPRPVLELLDLGEELAVVGVELVVGPPVALDQRVADEQLARDLGVDPAVVDLPLGDDRYAVQRDLLVRHDGRLVLLPVRLAVGALDQVLGQRLDPLGLHLGVDPGPQPRGLHQLGGHEELRLLLEERRAREDRELGGAGAQVLVLVGVLEADVREQALPAARCARSSRGRRPR